MSEDIKNTKQILVANTNSLYFQQAVNGYLNDGYKVVMIKAGENSFVAVLEK